MADLSKAVNDAKDGTLLVKVFQSYGFQQNGTYEKIVKAVKKTYNSVAKSVSSVFSGDSKA
jgi:hypothetical protein